MTPTSTAAELVCTPFRRSLEPPIRVRPTGSIQHLRLLRRGCSPHVHANAQRCDAELEIGPGNLLGGSDNPDRLPGKALHIRLDRTTVNGYVQKTERSVFIRYCRPGRAVRGARQRHSSAFARKRASVSSR